MKTLNTHRKFLTVVIGFALALGACKKKSKADDDEEEEDTTTVTGGGDGAADGGNGDTVPQVGAISLSELGTEEGASLLQNENVDDDGRFRCNQQGLGALTMPFGAACHTSPMAANALLGRDNGDFDGDGDMDCDDYTKGKADGKSVGLMLHLLCDKVMLENDNVVSLAFADEAGTQSFAVGFTDFPNDTTAAGSWTQGNAASYPADVRIWQGTTFDDFQGHIALGLTDVNNGSVMIDTNGRFGRDFQAAVTYSNKTDASGCVAAPTSETCHNQDIRMYSGEGAVVGPPNGFHMKIYADDKAAPTFIALEGHFRYTAASAAAFSALGTGCPTGQLVNLRSLYFQAVQKGGQVWGHLAFRDENGDLLSCTNNGGGDPFADMAAADGLCQNRGTPTKVDCTDITPSDYADLWQGEAEFETVTASPVGDIWEGAPTERGVCTTTGCGPVQ